MVEQINLPVPIKWSGPVKKINEILEKKGNVTLDWLGLYTIYRFFYLYLFKKYKHNCRLYSEQFLGIDLENNFDTLSKHNLLKNVQQFKKCYDKGSDMVIIPLRFSTGPRSRHANFLLFKRGPRIIEHFEPYGKKIRQALFVNKSINFFVDEINKLIDVPIRYSPVEESCHEIGVQYQEEDIEAQPKEVLEGGGYCVIWSMFFAELSLTNPELNLKELTDIIYSINTPGLYMRDIARGYVYFFYEKMDKYFSQYLSPIMTFQKYIKNINNTNSIMKKHINDATNVLDELFDIEIELYENPDLTIEELHQSTGKNVDNLNKKYDSTIAPVQKKNIRFLVEKEIIKQHILYKMIKNKANLDKFTPLPVTEKQPEVLVMDVRSSTISKVATPLQQIRARKQPNEKVKPPCKPGKERNAQGRCVKIQTAKKSRIMNEKPKTEKVKPPCKPGKERNAQGRCVKIKLAKSSMKTVQIEKILLPNVLPDNLSSLSSLSSESPISLPPYMPNQSVQKVKPPCKPGKERNSQGRCVKIKTVKKTKIKKPKSKTLKTKPLCKPGKARNADGRCVKIENIK